MDLEQEVRINTANIAAVTNTVTRLATVQENAERQRAEDRELMRRAVEGLNTLNDKMNATMVMQENIKQLGETLVELKSDVHTLRHDHNNTKASVQGISLMADKISGVEKSEEAIRVRCDALEGRLNTMEGWRDKMDGAGGAFKAIGGALWAVFGTGLVALGLFVFKLFFAQAPQ